jgi:hypothetical protein
MGVMSRFVPLILLSLSMPLAFCSCGKERAPASGEGAPSESFAVHKNYGAGPVKFSVELSAGQITTSDALTCRMTLDLGPDYQADFPELAFPDDVPGAILTRYDEHEKTEGDHRVLVREYEIEPESEGTLKFPAMEVYYHRGAEVKEERLEIEPLEVTVKPASIEAGALEFKPVRGLIEADRIAAMQRRIWPKVLAGVLAVVMLAAGGIYWIRRPRVAPPPPPAHVLALERLRDLEHRDWIGLGLAEPFFVAVTGIVRDYIEQAFGLRAPEQTTEEFLAGLSTATEVAAHRDVLQPFLIAADEVKFARIPADQTTMRRAFETAEHFVRQTSHAMEGAAR